jgi:hypothetical protein
VLPHPAPEVGQSHRRSMPRALTCTDMHPNGLPRRPRVGTLPSISTINTADPTINTADPARTRSTAVISSAWPPRPA